MIKYTHKQISKYRNIYNALESLGIITVISELETGKTFISEEFLKTLDCEKWMINNIGGENGLKKLYNQILQKIDNSSADSISFDSIMKRSVINYLIQPKPKVVVLDDFESYNYEVLNFWGNVLSSASDLTKSKCLFIVNINSTSNIFESNLLRNNSMYIHPCNLSPWEAEDLKELFHITYRDKIKINNKDLEIVIDYSLNNPVQLLDNIYALKAAENIIYNFNDNIWECNRVDENILNMRHSEKINLRYNRLDSSLKIAINKASLIGCNFNSLILTNIFEIQNAKNIFRRIEDISKLILVESMASDDCYRFISERVRNEIETYIVKEDIAEWRRLLGHYYFETLNDSRMPKTQKAINLERAAKYFYDCCEFENSMRCKNELVKLLVDIECYFEAIFQLESLTDLIKKIRVNENFLTVYFYYLCLYNLKLFRFDQSLKYFKLYKKSNPSSEKQNVYENIYIGAFLNYNMSDTPHAYKMLNEAYQDITKKDKDNIAIDWNNACKILELFVSVCDSMDDKRKINIYNYALHIAKKYGLEERYYTLLRKAAIAHGNESSIKLMSDAKDYFFERDASEYAMVTHNIAMEYIFIPNRLNDAFSEISISKRVFDEIGSGSSNLTRNVLGIYYCFKENYSLALREFSKIDSGDSFCSLAALINRINCFRKLKLHEAETEAMNEAESINSKENNRFLYFSGALLVLRAYALMEKNEESSDKDAIMLLDKYLEAEDFCDRVEQTLSVKLTMQLLKNKYNIDAFKDQQLDEKCINPIAKFLSDERLYFCEIQFIE